MTKLRIGIIGTGGRGIQSFGALLSQFHAENVTITAVADPNPARAEAGLAWLKLDGVAIVPTAADLVRRRDVDAVIVTSPDCFHEEHALLAFAAKKHVFVDKPLAITVDGCLRILEASRRSERLLYMGFNLRHDIVIRQLKTLAMEGRFGEIFSIQAMEHYNGGRTYHCRWNRLKKNTGGLFIHKGSHDFDVINHLMGTVRPTRVSCFGNVFTFKPDRLPFPLRKGVKPGPNCNDCPYQAECPDKYVLPATAIPDGQMFSAATAKVDGYRKNLCMYLSDKDTHDQGIAIVEYENGATASHSEYFATPLSNRIYQIEGTGGHATADLHDTRVTFNPRWSNDQVTYQLQPPEGGHGGADPIMVDNFLECIRTGQRPLASGIDGTWSVAVAVAAEKSRAEHRMIAISELLDRDSELLK